MCEVEKRGTEEDIPLKDHTWVTDDAVVATCQQNGKTEGKHCSVCGHVEIPQEDTSDPNNHTNPVDVAYKAATCTATGQESGKKCTACNTTIEGCENIPINLNNHPPLFREATNIPAVEGTCVAEAWSEGKKCSACGTTTVAPVEGSLDPNNHPTDSKYIIDYKAETCKENGQKAGVGCKACKKVVEGGGVILAGHKFEDKTDTTEENKAYDATCNAAAGYYIKCKVCSEKSNMVFPSGSALGHNFWHHNMVFGVTTGYELENYMWSLDACNNCTHWEYNKDGSEKSGHYTTASFYHPFYSAKIGINLKFKLVHINGYPKIYVINETDGKITLYDLSKP